MKDYYYKIKETLAISELVDESGREQLEFEVKRLLEEAVNDDNEKRPLPEPDHHGEGCDCCTCDDSKLHKLRNCSQCFRIKQLEVIDYATQAIDRRLSILCTAALNRLSKAQRKALGERASELEYLAEELRMYTAQKGSSKQ